LEGRVLQFDQTAKWTQVANTPASSQIDKLKRLEGLQRTQVRHRYTLPQIKTLQSCEGMQWRQIRKVPGTPILLQMKARSVIGNDNFPPSEGKMCQMP